MADDNCADCQNIGEHIAAAVKSCLDEKRRAEPSPEIRQLILANARLLWEVLDAPRTAYYTAGGAPILVAVPRPTPSMDVIVSGVAPNIVAWVHRRRFPSGVPLAAESTLRCVFLKTEAAGTVGQALQKLLRMSMLLTERWAMFEAAGEPKGLEGYGWYFVPRDCSL
ncbi:hypothetical protein LTR53_012915 [Teratosphaeriaceae sp. CCFEE 6253]|nr:hypothetical protein LTR53_012915 [Teratosphaeriaceae sp. CCFEE 6253]